MTFGFCWSGQYGSTCRTIDSLAVMFGTLTVVVSRSGTPGVSIGIWIRKRSNFFTPSA